MRGWDVDVQDDYDGVTEEETEGEGSEESGRRNIEGIRIVEVEDGREEVTKSTENKIK